MFSEDLQSALYNASSDVLSDAPDVKGDMLAGFTANVLEGNHNPQYEELMTLVKEHGWTWVAEQMQTHMASK